MVCGICGACEFGCVFFSAVCDRTEAKSVFCGDVSRKKKIAALNSVLCCDRTTVPHDCAGGDSPI